MVAFAVNIPSFQDSRFHVIDSVWESESFVGLRNFTLMAGIYSIEGCDSQGALDVAPHPW